MNNHTKELLDRANSVEKMSEELAREAKLLRMLAVATANSGDCDVKDMQIWKISY